MKNGKKRILFFLCCLLSLTMPGCGKKEGDVKLVLTTGFKKDEIFRIETMSCTLPEVMVYLTNTQDQYESVYGIKETVLAQLAQIKTMNLLAQQHGVSLEDEEREKAREAAGIYFGSLNETEREAMQVNEEIIEQLYGELALANKVYEFIIKDINPEISDDEARSITIQDILIKTYSQDGAGKRIACEETAREDAYERAREILLLAREEENDFESLVLQYSEGEKGTYSFGKGEVEEDFENAAFNLETGEISGVVETEDGFHIIKCISTFNREETDANKVKIVTGVRRICGFPDQDAERRTLEQCGFFGGRCHRHQGFF